MAKCNKSSRKKHVARTVHIVLEEIYEYLREILKNGKRWLARYISQTTLTLKTNELPMITIPWAVQFSSC
jgi:hypothetical protein